VETRKVSRDWSAIRRPKSLNEVREVGEIVGRTPAVRCTTATRSERYADELDRRNVDGTQYLGMVDPPNPLPSIVFSIILLVRGWVRFTKLAVDAAAARTSGDLGRRRAIAAAAAEL